MQLTKSVFRNDVLIRQRILGEKWMNENGFEV